MPSPSPHSCCVNPAATAASTGPFGISSTSLFPILVMIEHTALPAPVEAETPAHKCARAHTDRQDRGLAGPLRDPLNSVALNDRRQPGLEPLDRYVVALPCLHHVGDLDRPIVLRDVEQLRIRIGLGGLKLPAKRFGPSDCIRSVLLCLATIGLRCVNSDNHRVIALDAELRRESSEEAQGKRSDECEGKAENEPCGLITMVFLAMDHTAIESPILATLQCYRFIFAETARLPIWSSRVVSRLKEKTTRVVASPTLVA